MGAIPAAPILRMLTFAGLPGPSPRYTAELAKPTCGAFYTRPNKFRL